jgi:sialate O-acetylesterase
MTAKRSILIFLAALAFLFAFHASAGLKLPAMFSDNMVLQRGAAVPVWGWGDDGDEVTVTFRGKTRRDRVSNLSWHVYLPSMKAGGPDTLVIKTKMQTIELKNVLVGDVWVCSGQSNMEWSMGGSFEPEADIASATNAVIRLFKTPKNRQLSPTVTIQSSWESLSPQSVEGFSAVGYYFGRALHRNLNVPIGLIGTYWGGTPAEAWISRPGLEINPRLRKELLDKEEAAMKNHKQALQEWEKERDAAKAEGKPFDKRAPYQPWIGAELYNGMIAPLLPYGIKGAIWYQGESNAGRAHQYRELFPDMIRSWRRSWDNDFTFLCVQLAPFMPIQPEPGESAWAELREAQLIATKTLPKTGMAVITDVGDEKDIHPRKKEPVGERLALAARGIAYGQKIEYSGPVYKSLEVKDGKAILSFDHVGSGLVAKGGPMTGFAIAGEDRKFVWANAWIENDTVVVSSGKVANPVAVRYGWADHPVVNLWNKDGLPATPFRTDDFPMITAPKE